METTQELDYLRARRAAEIAIRDLENEAASVSKRYRLGVKSLICHIQSIDTEIDEGGAMAGLGVLETISSDVTRLMADPTLQNIPDDTNV